MEDRLRISIEVVAGVLPGKPDPEFTKRWHITSDYWYNQGSREGKQKENEDYIMQQYGHAMEYARTLWNPERVNWVRIDWIYY